MLANKYVPTPLIERAYHRHVSTDDLPRHLRWKTWHVFIELVRLAAFYVRAKLKRQLTPQLLGQKVAESCQRQGVLWVKFGQLMAMRNDIFSPEFCGELGKLHDRAPGFPPDEAIRLIEQELGQPIDHYFRDFDPNPVAAASIAQVHIARLKDNGGSPVAIKLQRADAAPTLQVDMVIFERLIRIFKWFRIKPLMRWDDLLWEIQHVMSEELDFRIEAANMRRMRKRLRQHKVYVPKLFSQFTTQRVLVMEFVHGVPMADYLRCQRENPQRLARWREENNVVPEKVGRRLLLSYLQQLFEDRLFHADMHPGNILLLKDSRIAVIDFGSIGFMERDLLRKYDGYMEALGQGNYSKAIDMLLMTTNSLPPTNLSGLKEELLRITSEWEARCRIEGLDYDDTSAAGLLDDTTSHAMQWGIDQNWTFLKVIRSWATMDISLRALLSESNLKELLVRYYRDRQRRQYWELLEARPLAASDLERGLKFGETAIENAFLRGTILRRMGRVFEGTTNKVHQFFAIGFLLAVLGLTGIDLILFFAIVAKWQLTSERFASIFGSRSASGDADENLYVKIYENFHAQITNLDYQMLFVGAFLASYLILTFWKLRSRFQAEEDNTSYL